MIDQPWFPLLVFSLPKQPETKILNWQIRYAKQEPDGRPHYLRDNIFEVRNFLVHLTAGDQL